MNGPLGLVARKLGKLTKGGIPNHDMAARIVLNDWNSGKIKYFTLPPETVTKETHVSAEVVSTFAKEFSLENLDKMDQDDLSDLPAVKPSEEAFLAVGSSGMIETINQEEAIESMEEDSDEEVWINLTSCFFQKLRGHKENSPNGSTYFITIYIDL
jgi:nuclear GTP-binding protein